MATVRPSPELENPLVGARYRVWDNARSCDLEISKGDAFLEALALASCYASRDEMRGAGT